MRSKAVAFVLATLTAGAAGCGGKTPSPTTTDVASPDGPATPVTPDGVDAPGLPTVEVRVKALNDLLAESWEDNLKTHPEFASILGDPRYNDRWSDQSLEAVAAELAKDKDYLARFKAIDTTGFPDQDLLNHQLMVRELQERVDDARFQDWLMPVNQMGGLHLFPPRLASMLRFSTVKDYEDYIARLEKLPVVFDQVILLMRSGLEKGLMPPKVQLELTIGQAAGLGKGKPAESPFAMPALKFAEGIAKEDQERLRAAILKAVSGQVMPAYVKLAAFLKDEYVPHGRKDPGVWALPDGEARYAAAVKSNTTIAISADELHALGLSEVARIEGEELAIAKALKFKDLAAFRTHVRKNKKLLAKSSDDIIARYQQFTDQMYEQLPKLFGRLPKQKMEIKPTEAFREKDAAAAEYMPGAPDGSRPGRVNVRTYQATKTPVTDIEATAYHEGVPGHHMQLTIQQELPELPPFRQYGGFTAFAEGWALYSEALGKEVGFYKDPYSDFGRLEAEMLRAIRLVVDTGLHHKKWSRDQVVKYFRDHSTLEELEINNETNRYIVWPGQALAYKVGQLTILRLRTKAQELLGAKFDIRAFHDEVLGGGALPLDVLELRIDAWIARVAKS